MTIIIKTLFYRKFKSNSDFIVKTCRSMSNECRKNYAFNETATQPTSENQTGNENNANRKANSGNCRIDYTIEECSQKEERFPFDWVGKYAPLFKLNGNKVEIIKGPREFHKKLKDLTRNSKQRILLGSLYLGTGPLEQELVDCLKEAMKESDENDNGNLKVTVILDHMRASRGSKNSRTMLLPLINQHFNSLWSSPQSSTTTTTFPLESSALLTSPQPSSKSKLPSPITFLSQLPSSANFSKNNCKSLLQLFLYHTPDLNGWLKKMMPERFNEIIGLFHIKAYIFDDNIILSGANLSETYFSNRQDRYILIKNFKPLADFYGKLFKILSKYSFLVQSDDTLQYGNAPNPCANYKENMEFRKKLKQEVDQLIISTMDENCHSYSNHTIQDHHHHPRHQPHSNDVHYNISGNVNDDDDETNHDTIIYPLLQMGPVGVTQDEIITRELFLQLPEKSTIYLASGYFNITDEYMNIIINSSSSSFHIITAAPQANSFYKSPGLSGFIPPAYTYISSCFLQQVRNNSQSHRIKMYEYNRPNWTVHSKGLWLYPPQADNGPHLPYLSLVGSSNYGYRSVKRDLENQLLIVTRNMNLRLQLHEERLHLYNDSYELTQDVLNSDDRKVPYWVALLAPKVKTFF